MKSKKVLKEEYKNQKPQIGVFEFLNTSNGKRLIEGSTNIQSKWNRHRMELKLGSHRNKQLQQDWDAFGEEHFRFNVLSELNLKKDDNSDINEELKLLKKLVEEELNIQDKMKY